MNNSTLATRMSLLNTESAFQILAKAGALEAQGRSIIHCEIGQPDFNTPQNIITAANHALEEGYTGYGPAQGYPILRETIADYYTDKKKIRTDADEVVVVPGGKPVMFYTMLMLVNPGDEVIYPDPGFPIYRSCVRFAGGVPVAIPLRQEKDFCLDPEELSSLITTKTKLIILNSPSNPTGGAFTQEDLREIAEILEKRPDIYVLSDEIYDRLSYESEIAPSIAAFPGMKERTVILNGFSKTYSMTGWRLGYGIMNRKLADAMTLLMINSNSCAASFTQMAGVEALTGPQDSVTAMKQSFRERRDWLVPALNEIPGISCNIPKGAFYAFPNISAFGLPCKDFCDRLLEEAGVAAAWGTSFGDAGEGFLRLSYATSLENLKIAVERIKDFTAGLCK